MFGVHVKVGSDPVEIKLAKELGFDTIVLWDTFWYAPGYDVPARPQDIPIRGTSLDILAEEARKQGLRVGLKIHATPGNVGLVGDDQRYSWWEGFFVVKDVEDWFDAYATYVFIPLLSWAYRNADYFWMGNEMYSTTRCGQKRWLSFIGAKMIIDGLKEPLRGGSPPQLSYASFFTSPLANAWPGVLARLAGKIVGERRLLRLVLDKFAGPNRFRLATKEREKEVAREVLRHRNTWRTYLDFVSVNCYWPVWWFRKEPTVGGYYKAYTEGPLGINYYKLCRKFAGNKPLVISEFWVSDDDSDWGEPGKAKEIIEAGIRFWHKNAEGLVLWRGPSYWERYVDILRGGRGV